MSKNLQGIQVESQGLTGTGIGLWLVKKIEGQYYFYHTQSSCDVYGYSLDEMKPSVIYGEEWQDTSKKVCDLDPTYPSIIEETKMKFHKILSGETGYCSYASPWLDANGNPMFVVDQIFLVDRDTDGSALSIVGTTVNTSLGKQKQIELTKLAERNKKLLDANQHAVDLAGLLVWSMNFTEYPMGNTIFSNKKYKETLGLDENELGLSTFDSFVASAFPDDSGKQSMDELLIHFNTMKVNKSYNYFNVVVKHQHIKTKEVVYLDHYTRLESRFENGDIKQIGGYIINITDRIMMEKQNTELNKRNLQLQRAQRIAVKSGKVMIWYINTEESKGDSNFYGNELLFLKLGLDKHDNNHFKISDFNETVYTGDEEGMKMRDEYFALDGRVIDNEIDSYDKLIVKHQNLKTKEIFYFDHNFEVEERYRDGRLKIRGGFMTDVTEEIQYKKRIEFLVNKDLVTGLRNRNSFERFIKSKKLPENYTLIIADIDGLKFINDAFGHIKGDEVIGVLGKILSSEFDKDSYVFRIGGDEFAIISSDLGEESIQNRLGKVRESIKDYTESSNIAFNISVGYETVMERATEFNDAFIHAENIMYRRKLGDRNSRKSKTMETVLQTLNEKTEETKEHCDRLGIYAVKTLKELGYSRSSDLDDIRLLCSVHDVGKITISEDILSKPGGLTSNEYDKIKSHSESGYKIVKNIVESDRIAFGVLYHHERHDGKGYPFGIPGNEIPLFAKVLTICDAYDVMIFGREYQKKVSKKAAFTEIEKCSGTQFDPEIAKAFIKAMKK